ncbi:MAG: sugar phosphate isomerase/epimerase [Terracidiphilus sp.]|jgi:sugar phosphate isomerase/epimerase
MSITSRRSFLKAGAVAAAVCAGADRLAAKSLRIPVGLKLPVGLQLYTVRQLLAKDFDGTLSKIKTAGYAEVEAAGYYDRTAAEFREAMDKTGLRCTSTHHPLDMLRTRLDELIEYGHKLGVDYIVSPSASHRNPAAKGPMTMDDWRFSADELNRVGEKVKAAGITFGYHNHDAEFGSEDGVIFYDELLKLTDPRLVVFEMDCGWVVATGANPVEYLIKSPDRFPLLHVKDMVQGANGEYHSTVMGKGVVDYPAILRAAKGLKRYYIEQEDFDMDPIAAIRLDAEYMHKLKL